MIDTPPPRGPLMSPGFWLHHAALAWRQAMDAGLRPMGLTHTQFNLLASVNWLTNQTGPPTQQQAAELSGADRMMTSKVLTTLEARGLLTRVPDPADSRTNRLIATAEGRDLVRRAVQAAAEVDAAFFGAGPDREDMQHKLREIAERRTGR
ncbi:MarR family winged helix-turn-helix transcriptional regulator [Actinoallomurus sp. NPDC050550]|uniref:MarR family winged helix-turn-helix transcriptional regulator n=1 Tax=Actinoallomurus sp. NPDC050550 TaxID=3154937 RepID=UPI0033FACC5E